MKLYVVYKHTDPEGKVYIGITQKLPRKRFDYGRGYRHNHRFNEAIERIGWDNFKHDILAEGLTREEAEALEARYIAEYQSTDPTYGYNVKTGGTYGKGMSEEGRRKLSESMRGDNNPTRRCGHPFLGKKHTDESKRKMAAKASARVGRIVTAETRSKMREAQKKRAVIDLETGTVYDGIHEAAEVNGLRATDICKVCRGRAKTTGGKRWSYYREKEKGQDGALEALRLEIVKR